MQAHLIKGYQPQNNNNNQKRIAVAKIGPKTETHTLQQDNPEDNCLRGSINGQAKKRQL